MPPKGWLLSPAETDRRFWLRVEKTATCWIWKGHVLAKGKAYGQVHIRGKSMMAHRYPWEQKHGPVPPRLQLDHLCRNRLCVNPNHLEAVSARENIMRSTGVAAINAKRTKCVNGHELSPENTKTSLRKDGNTRRHCRKCWAAANRRYREKKLRGSV